MGSRLVILKQRIDRRIKDGLRSHGAQAIDANNVITHKKFIMVNFSTEIGSVVTHDPHPTSWV